MHIVCAQVCCAKLDLLRVYFKVRWICQNLERVDNIKRIAILERKVGSKNGCVVITRWAGEPP